MNRRQFITSTGFSLGTLLITDSILGNWGSPAASINFPDAVSALINGQMVTLSGKNKTVWTYNALMVGLANTENGLGVTIQCPGASLSSITLEWNIPIKATSSILNDHWERTYGDASWSKPEATGLLPWYFMENDGKATNGFGVKTGGATFCSWELIIFQMQFQP